MALAADVLRAPSRPNCLGRRGTVRVCRTRVTWLARTGALALVGLLAAESRAAGQAPSAPDGRPAATRFRVRGQDRLSIEVLEMGLRLSPTVRRLVDELEGSDVIALIETGWLPGNLTGQVRLLCAKSGHRYLRVTLRIPNGRKGLVRTLGHELQHAVEIARMPGVTTDKRLAEAYGKTGFPLERAGLYETREARDARLAVGRELAAKPDPPR